ncbi:MAG TPA: SIMPL domain-containing protein [Isosphaeraceae bacterium]|jgi:hypothetical protein
MIRASIGLAVGVAALVFGPSSALRGDEEMKNEPSLSVNGVGRVSAAPDVAEIGVGVTTQGGSAQETLRANTQAMTALLAELKQRGVAAKDVQTTNISVNPRYSQPAPRQLNQPQEESAPRIVGYDVTNMVQITARDLTKLGSVLDAVVQAGANQIQGIRFRIDEPENLLDEARMKAMANARHKAEILAQKAEVVLGPPIRILESGGETSPPMPLMALGRGMAAMAAAPVPVAAGEQELSVTVQVVYSIRPSQ